VNPAGRSTSARPGGHSLLDDRSQAEALALAAFEAQRCVDHVPVDDDHGIAHEELGTFAVRREEGPLVAFEPLRSVNRDALAGHEFGQRLDLALNPARPFVIDVDEPLPAMAAAELEGLRRQPAAGLFMEDDDVFGRRDADDHFAQLSPLVVCAEQHGQTRA